MAEMAGGAETAGQSDPVSGSALWQIGFCAFAIRCCITY